MRVNAFRAVLVALGTLLGTAGFVSASGISETLSYQVTSDFDALRATEVLVSEDNEAGAEDWTATDDLERLRHLPGVVEAGVIEPTKTVAATRPPMSRIREVSIRPVDAATLRVVRPRIVTGRSFDAVHVSAGLPVVMLSLSVADRLGVVRVGSAIELSGQTFTVIGIYDDVARREELLLEALVPIGLLRGHADGQRPEVVIETEPGAALAVAEAAPKALHPESPRALAASAPLDPVKFRRGVERNVRSLVVGAIVITLAVGTISIAGSATAAVYERIGEIGLRRVMGARPSHVFAQLLTETFAIGAAGGVVGSGIGLALTFFVSMWNDWVPVMDLSSVAIAVALGAGSGLVAGLIPAWKATRLEPVDALRR